MFIKAHYNKPIYIILTTLAAHAYGQESNRFPVHYIVSLISLILILNTAMLQWIPNPTDPAENFADRWEKYLERKRAFYEWLNQAHEDFSAAAQASNRMEAVAA